MTKRILLVLGITLLIGGGVLGLLNQRQATRQANAIIAADNQALDTTAAIAALKAYAADHTGAGVTFTLSAAYARAQAAATAQASAAANSVALYSQAQQACSGRTDSITQSRCVQDYVSKRLVKAPAPAQVAVPQAADFAYRFRNRAWAPDGAGALLLGGALALVAGVVMTVRGRIGR